MKPIFEEWYEHKPYRIDLGNKATYTMGKGRENEFFHKDYECFTKGKYMWLPCAFRMIKNYELRFLYFLRKYQSAQLPLLRGGYRLILNHYRKRYGIEIICKNIGMGLRLIHPWGITVNSNAHLGNYITLYKGVTIGEVTEGRKKGNPTIGDDVVIYTNATVCGNVTIGSGTKIAAGAFVNFDVPEDSVVIGNPGEIYKKQNQ